MGGCIAQFRRRRNASSAAHAANTPDGPVAKARASRRAFHVLEMLNVKPSVTYLARVRNPNPDMPDTYNTPLSTREFLDHGGSLHGHAADAHGAPGEVGHAVPGAPNTHGTEAAAPAGQKGAH